jgi:hypothetical protein
MHLKKRKDPMRKETIAQINYEFLCSNVVLTLINSNFIAAIMASFEKPVKLSAYGKTKGFLIISNKITKKLEKSLLIDKIPLGLITKISEQIKGEIQGELSNRVVVEIDGFRFKFKIMKYAISSYPNIYWIPIEDLNKNYRSKDIHPIVDLEITSVFD